MVNWNFFPSVILCCAIEMVFQFLILIRSNQAIAMHKYICNRMAAVILHELNNITHTYIFYFWNDKAFLKVTVKCRRYIFIHQDNIPSRHVSIVILLAQHELFSENICWFDTLSSQRPHTFAHSTHFLISIPIVASGGDVQPHVKWNVMKTSQLNIKKIKANIFFHSSYLQIYRIAFGCATP